MAQKAYFIGPYESGLETRVKDWLLPEDAFSYLRNAYVWRSQLKKRVGSKLFPWDDAATQQLGSRLRIKINTTDGSGNATQAGGAIPGAITGASCVGQMFSIGDEMFTVHQTVTPVTMLKTGTTTTATYNTTTLNYTFVGAAAATDIFWYPALPVMGITTYDQPEINNENTIVFDQKFSYERDGTTNAWKRAGLLTWSGSNSQFFWYANYRGVTSYSYNLFVVNYNRADQICYWDGTTFTRTTFRTKLNNAAPIVAANYVLQSARILIVFKNTIIALNTLESVDDGAGNPVNQTFTGRARWHAPAGPFSTNAWMDDVAGKGGFIDASTKEAIITAQIYKDRLIVFFERSTWELIYTGNKVQPFLWQNIVQVGGAESTFSPILLDDKVLGVGQNGIYSCDGLNVKRIDEKIPDEVFKIHNGNDGVKRVAGIRDFVSEIAYWSFPHATHDTTYPDRMIVYNYKNDTWAFFDDSITAFGYYQNLTDNTWGNDNQTWGEDATLWGTGSGQSLYRNVLAGNQQGFTFLMDNKTSRNAPALQISDIDITNYPEMVLTISNHNLTIDIVKYILEAILIENVQGITNINDRVYIVSGTTATTITVIGDEETAVTGTYTGGGTIARATGVDIKTKAFNFYTSDYRVAFSRVDFNVKKTAAGLLFAQFYPSSSTYEIGSLANDGTINPFQIEMYPYELYPEEDYFKRLVRRIYPNAEGDSIKLHLYNNYTLYADGYEDALSDFTLHSMTFYAGPTATR